MKKNKGITLIALVITIIVLLILAGVTINAIVGNESSMEKAKEAKTETDIAHAKDAASLRATAYIQEYMEKRYVQNDSTLNNKTTGEYVAQEMNNKTEGEFTFTVSNRALTVKKAGTNIVSGNIEDNGSISWTDVDNSGNGGDNNGGGDDTATVRTVTVNTFASLNTDAQLPSDKNTIAQKGTGDTQQQIVIPAGFIIASDSGTTLEEGMVIEDATNGNQFVWIPVNQTLTFANGTTGQIELGRYSFNGSNTPNYTREVKQDGTDDGSIIISDSSIITIYNPDIEDYESEEYETNFIETQGNSKAINIADFKSKTNTAKGYYIGRYEAGIENGVYDTTNKVWNKVDSTKDIKTVCKKNATVYNYIIRGDNAQEGLTGAVKEAREMYSNNTGYISDLINGYAWDTAIVFIEQCGANNVYAFQSGISSISTSSPQLTGTNRLEYDNEKLDIQCNICDMAGNISEWTTEYCSDIIDFEYDKSKSVCTFRGDLYTNTNDEYYPGRRGMNSTKTKGKNFGFRPILYILETN